MKKIALVLACAASLGLWISCDNGAQDVNLKLDSGLIEKSYKNYGTATATKVTMVTRKGAEVDFKDGEPANKPTDGKNYYVGSEQTLSKDGIDYKYYWYYNEWDAGTEVTFDNASISWNDNLEYDGDGIVGYESVSNGKDYYFYLEYKDDVKGLCRQYKLLACGNAVRLVYNEYEDFHIDRFVKDDFNTALFAIEGSLEGNFTINESLKARDWCYAEYEDQRLDERIEYRYEYIGNVWNDEIQNYEPVFEYIPTKYSVDTSVYYLKDVKFTKN